MKMNVISCKNVVNPFGYPKVTLCGSTKFRKEFLEAAKILSLKGFIVLSPFHFSHCGDKINSASTLQLLNDMHKQKIEMSDCIYVINVNGYIGDSTRREIQYAQTLGKDIYYMYEVPYE